MYYQDEHKRKIDETASKMESGLCGGAAAIYLLAFIPEKNVMV